MALPVLITVPFTQDAKGTKMKKDFMEHLAGKIADTAEVSGQDNAFYEDFAFYPLDPQDRDPIGEDDDELIKSRVAKLGCEPVALPIQHTLSPTELLCLLQQEFNWVLDIVGQDRRRDSEDEQQWQRRTSVQPRQTRALFSHEEAPGNGRRQEPKSWNMWSYRFLVVADTTELYRGFVTSVLLFACSEGQLRRRANGEIQADEDASNILAQHRYAAHFLCQSPEWCRDRAIGAVRTDARSVCLIYTAVEGGSSLNDFAGRAWDDGGMEGVYISDEAIQEHEQGDHSHAPETLT